MTVGFLVLCTKYWSITELFPVRVGTETLPSYQVKCILNTFVPCVRICKDLLMHCLDRFGNSVGRATEKKPIGLSYCPTWILNFSIDRSTY